METAVVHLRIIISVQKGQRNILWVSDFQQSGLVATCRFQTGDSAGYFVGTGGTHMAIETHEVLVTMAILRDKSD